ncbi:hypothetical protein [Variovorax sp. YR216]|uniref:hypothetical protein n=1 Tax=Variovorax sp. YR216 TaxID=1882828 RepID=UPI0008999C4F|nr:hypothetical protein [Variovorax sp. YR216]SEA57910.1 PXPV repeat-containing protein [Variovorax sp. YR216]
MSFPGSAIARLAFAAVVAATALSPAVSAYAEVNVSVGVGGPVYYEPAPAYVAPPPAYYQPAPPAYYQPPPPVYYPAPPAYYQPAPPAYYAPAPGYYGAPASRPRLSDMQQRALNNCVLLAPSEQRRCRATVMSTVR